MLREVVFVRLRLGHELLRELERTLGRVYAAGPELRFEPEEQRVGYDAEFSALHAALDGLVEDPFTVLEPADLDGGAGEIRQERQPVRIFVGKQVGRSAVQTRGGGHVATCEGARGACC